MEAPKEVQKILLSELKPNPFNESIYGPVGNVDDLAESIRQHGQMSPMLFRPDKTLISGHRRLAAMLQIGLEEADCIVFEPKNPTEEETLLIECNRARNKSMVQIRKEGERLKALLSGPAMQKRMACLHNSLISMENMNPLVRVGQAQTRGQAESVDTRAEIAEQLGLSKTKWNRIEYVNKYVEIGNPVALEASKLLNAEKISVYKAYTMVLEEVKALAAAESGGTADAQPGEAQPPTADEFNIACKQRVGDAISTICDVLDKVDALEDSEFNSMPWRDIAARARLMNKKLEALQAKIDRKRGQMFAKPKIEEDTIDEREKCED